ncbi:MAG: apolipoprotein N-acyltransferase [Candidatus Competibacteraceae bacterium]|nr:apolipoprotein N-acyltransferase [Candidatus Competibacteraceae bacterium]
MQAAIRHHSFFTDLLVFIAGVLMPLAFAPFGYWPLAIVLPIILLWSWDNATPRQAGQRGGLFGLGMFGFGIYWIYISLHDYGNAPAPFAVLATFVVVLVLALYLALAGWLTVRWASASGTKRWLLFVPAAWALLEWIRSWLFTGFPWLALGYSQIDSPLGQLAPYLGVFGIGWAVMLSSGLFWAAINGQRWRARLGWLGVLAALWFAAWGLEQTRWTESVGPALRLAIVQGNIAQEEKWQPGQLDSTLERYVQLSLPEHGRSDVIVWPETAISAFYQNVLPFVEALGERARQDKVDYVTGIPTGSWEENIFHNSVMSIGNTVAFYHKHRLLPFGEYLPLRWFFQFFRDWVTIPMADFLPGDRHQPLLVAGGHPVGVSICFEAVFGEEIRLALPEAAWLINVSNDAWFKDSTAPHQHLQIARMRSLETGRYMARATNTGISAIIDDRGRITAQGPQFQATVVRGEVQPRRGLTPYARFGDLPVVILVILLLALGAFLNRSYSKTTA